MFDFIFQIDDVYLFASLSAISVTISIISIFYVKRWIPLRLRYRDNAVIGNTVSLISLIYGVLAGFSALYLINNNSYAADAVQREANAVADIYRDSKWLSNPAQTNIQLEIKKYLTQVIDVEWPLMAKGKDIDTHLGNTTVDRITNELINYHGSSNAESLLLHDMLDEVRSFYDARQQRIHMSDSGLSPELWVVILIGTILTLGVNYLFGMNFYLHIITVTAAALMASSMIFLLVTLDKPFQGEFAIEPDAFRSILISIDRSTHNPLAAHERNVL